MIPLVLRGANLPSPQFCVRESVRTLEPAQVLAVLRGEIAAYVVHDFLPERDCRTIGENFWASPARKPRYGHGEGGFEGYLVGASHIEKSTAAYLAESTSSARPVRDLYAGTMDPFQVFRASIAEAGQVACVRAARSGGLTAGHSKAVCWSGVGPFLLAPHDDMAQLRDPRQAGFEIQRAGQVLAVNIYPAVPAGSGQIQIWNLAPDDASRDSLGLRYSGFPYPAELLRDVPSKVIPVATGDLCLVNGNLVHAVLRGNPDALSPAKRLLLTCFMGMIDQGEVIWWT